jgi:hypothetical protein
MLTCARIHNQRHDAAAAPANPVPIRNPMQELLMRSSSLRSTRRRALAQAFPRAWTRRW